MKLLIRDARIHCPGSDFHGHSRDIFLAEGIISQIGERLSVKTDSEIRLPDLHVSPGWMDVFSLFGEPGFEYRETLASGAAAAAAGGFTDLVLMPNTNPALSNRSQIENIIGRSSTLPVTIHPAASVTKGNSGKELAEMYDLHAGGAVAFSDGILPVQDNDILLKALQYIKAINGIIIQVPDDRSIQPGGLMNEGVISTRLGLPGKSSLAEEMMVSRCIDLVRYTAGRMHLSGISTAKSVAMVKQAKKEGLDLTCSVTPYHIFFTDEDLVNYDTNLRVDPPLRTTTDKQELINGLKDGTIDCIASHHIPLHSDEKVCEFEKSLSGMNGLESCFCVSNTVMGNHEMLLPLMYEAPRKIFGIEVPAIKPGEKACLTLFSPEGSFIPEAKKTLSLSKNSAFEGKQLKGRVYGIFNKGQLIMNS